jgi:hypothetical protein
MNEMTPEANRKSTPSETTTEIKAAFAANDQLHKATYLYNGDRLLRFLERTTGTKFELKERTIRLPEMDEEIPF